MDVENADAAVGGTSESSPVSSPGAKTAGPRTESCEGRLAAGTRRVLEWTEESADSPMISELAHAARLIVLFAEASSNRDNQNYYALDLDDGSRLSVTAFDDGKLRGVTVCAIALANTVANINVVTVPTRHKFPTADKVTWLHGVAPTSSLQSLDDDKGLSAVLLRCTPARPTSDDLDAIGVNLVDSLHGAGITQG